VLEPELTEEDDYCPKYIAYAKKALQDPTEDYIVAGKVKVGGSYMDGSFCCH